MITTKSSREIALMREAGRIVGLAHEAVAAAIKPGVTEKQIDKIVEDVILKHGATPSFKGLYGFPNAACISVNSVLVHGIPSNSKLKEGDIVSVDIGACYQGYHGDSAWTYAVGHISDEAKHLMDVTKESLFAGLSKVKAGNRLGDVSNTIGSYVFERGFSIPKEYAGHGVGTSVHEDPTVPNFGEANEGVILKEGMTLAIEPMVHAGKAQTKVLADEWTVVSSDGSLTAHYEHTIVVTKDGYEILTTSTKEGYLTNE